MAEQLDILRTTVAKEIDGLEMGVLADGRSYLSARSVGKLCGLAPSVVIEQAAAWKAGKRTSALALWLLKNGVTQPSLYVETDGSAHAYTDDICMLILDYYVFEAGRADEMAKERYRRLARAGLRVFVYHALGYDPAKVVPPSWREFHDRELLVTAPVGYFSIFKEISGFVIGAIRGGLKVDAHTIPDISVGQAWADHWKENNFDARFGERRRFEHNYPDYYPQAKSNPQKIWVYPVAALPEFRTWMSTSYVALKLPAYLDRKVAERVLPPSTAEILLLEAAASAPKLAS